MAEVLKAEDVKKNMKKYVSVLKKSVFIHPTDTIYGIGGDATRSNIVAKIREIKNRYTQAMSVMAPSKEWIRENFIITPTVEEWLKKLPGPYTLILKKKPNKKPVAKNVAPGLDTVGIRIPAHWIKDLVKLMNKPIITTSVNVTGNNYMTSLDDLDKEIEKKIDYIIYEGQILGHASTIVHLEGEKVVIRERKKKNEREKERE